MPENTIKPDYLFEVSWEICNKVGGINTVVATKALMLVNQLQDKFILIGPDLWRDTTKNPVFLEDKAMYRSWRQYALSKGLRVRIGRWDILGQPIVILVDFTTFFTQKNEVFSSFWETYQLDSISGGMDYIESAMFGYAAGVTIESFINYNFTTHSRCIAHFHEWMTGAGLLYLKKNAQHIATMFTTHATVVGRSIAGNGMDLYGKMLEYDGDTKARELNILAKHSMEKVSALNADCFTTVSEITATECEHFLSKKVDIVTPNGFEDSFVPKNGEYDEKRRIARAKLKQVTEAVLGYEISDDTLFLANSGRYEFRNKGIDIVIHACGKLKNNPELNKEIVVFILVPANNYGPRKDLIEHLYGDVEDQKPLEKSFLTHWLHYPEYDSILNEIKAVNLTNDIGDKVKIIYAPCYLDGNDSIFNLKYYDLLIGMDLTVFPSYYEPWGYTPLESLAFSVPTITTNLAGIGMWVNRELVEINDGIEVFERKVGIDEDLIKLIVNRVVSESLKSDYDRQRARENAYSISQIALWSNLIKHYNEAFGIALKKLYLRTPIIKQPMIKEEIIIPKRFKSNQPHWNTIIVLPNLPEKIKGLDELSKNLWWSWNYQAVELFESISPTLWNESNNNPVLMLKEIEYDRLSVLQDDPEFMKRYNFVYDKFKKYLAKKSEAKPPRIAYFSMEFGLHNSIKIYSGGLGILAGDYLKQASDSNADMIGLGFLYKFGYFSQQLSLKGEQLVSYEPEDFSNMPCKQVYDADGNWLKVQVALPGRTVHAMIWRLDVGRIPLYLLDTDIDDNSREDRSISHHLYGGDEENRLRQEMILGIGGMRAIEALNLSCDLYHCNEGHAAFIGLERLRILINNKNLTFSESLEIVRASTLFTTHTPVPAGHDSFTEDMMVVYMPHYPERLKINWEEFMNLGKLNPSDKAERFSMSHLAVNLSQEVNGVSRLHGKVTQHMFGGLWEGYYPEELHIGYVTNGVHYPTWASAKWQRLYESEFDSEFIHDQSNKKRWHKIYDVADYTIWDIREELRKELIDHIKDRLSQHLVKRHMDPRIILEINKNLSYKCLTIGFARRFATYKRAYLLFKDIDRLARIVNNKECPVHFLFAGKAHPRDGMGQDLIKRIVEISNRPEFIGKILFLQNYDIALAQKMVQGVDIWLNTPTRPLEASGTSGMKAVMNGVMNLSVLDGWWCEGYKEEAGWGLPEEATYKNLDFQDELDAVTIYSLLEDEIVPMYYNRNADGVPVEWVRYIKNCIANIAPEFTTKRMIDDYFNRFYNKLYKRTLKIVENDYEMAKRISTWKRRVDRGWSNIDVVSVDFPDSSKRHISLGETYTGEVVLELYDLADVSIGIEVVITDIRPDQAMEIVEIKEMILDKLVGTKAYYHIELELPRAGMFSFGLRMFPKHEDLPHRQDFPYVRWI